LIFSVHHDIQQIDDLVGSFGGFVLPTQLDRAYHTPLFSDGAEAMRRFYSRFPMSPLTSTVYSCCSAEPYPDLVTHQIDLLARQWCQPVRFRQALLNMHRDGYRCFLELNSSKTLLGFAESTFRGLDDVTLLSTGASIDLYAIDSFASAMISLWMQGFEIEWSKWHDLFAFSEQLSLPSISRPSSAITISHELYQFSHDDYTAGWAVTKPVDTLSDRSLCNNSPPQDSMVSRPAHESAPSSNESSKASIGLDEINNDFSPFHSHQLILRRALQSIDRNTRIIIDTINRQSS
jgi:acyl transferase domain-containing protein